MAPITHSQRDRGLTRLAFRPRSSGLSTLALPDAKISRRTLRQILHSCTALVDFTYGDRWDAEITDPWVRQDFDSLIKILSPFHDTLRSLILENRDPYPSESSPIRSLSQFTTLERFSTGTFAIIDNGSQIQDILPKGLIELELRDNYSRLTEAHGNDIHNVIRVFAETKPNLLPNLTKMVLTLDREDWEDSDLDLNKCLKNGVEFCIQIGELC
ncbi:hypothetical protein T440DRAFT_35678 [Plenodomus tracheiphilus IPT5]|uniref:Uncharacterized protein n=1 Tax=Plenodomus tracheiphilus IPT5 TaxID=1408161 RepID=A0A6A7AM27_9PLEO|nr:hypothetical protein T440DRAFT_35678 [Plenodomus tracheiphilus IPT5]